MPITNLISMTICVVTAVCVVRHFRAGEDYGLRELGAVAVGIGAASVLQWIWTTW